MGRARGVVIPGALYHVVNRSAERRQIFHEPADYAAFLALIISACRQHALEVLAYCLMPNHWHLVLRPLQETALSAYMQWLTARHVSLYRRLKGTVGYGHFYQARFRSSLIENEAYFWNAFVYVEANAQRANLVPRAEDWRWSSLNERNGDGRGIIVPPPVSLPPNWTELVNQGLDPVDLEQLRDGLRRGVPYRPVRLCGV